MRKTLLLSIILLSSMPGIQKSLIAQEKTSLNQVVNTLKERISLAGYAQLGYTYDDAAKPDNTFDIKRIIFMAHGKITKRWINPEKPDVPLNKNDAFQKVQKRRVQEKR